MTTRHGAPQPTPDPDRLPEWWLDDPDMWSGLTGDMGTYLKLERLEDGESS